MKMCLDCGRAADGSRGTRCKTCQRKARRPYNGTAYRQTPLSAVCACCGTAGDLTRDHIVPLAAGGTNHPGNIRTLCRPCNSSAKDTGHCRLEH